MDRPADSVNFHPSFSHFDLGKTPPLHKGFRGGRTEFSGVERAEATLPECLGRVGVVRQRSSSEAESAAERPVAAVQ